jgi:hypothetical protein
MREQSMWRRWMEWMTAAEVVVGFSMGACSFLVVVFHDLPVFFAHLT